MPRAAKACSHPDCSNVQPCELHQRKPWQDSTRRSRTVSGSRQQKRARFVMHRDQGQCHWCKEFGADQVDHVIPLAEGGPDDVDNMAPIHRVPCHRDKTQQEARRARCQIPIQTPSVGVPRFVVVVVGAPASGKTWVVQRAARQLVWAYRSIDDCGPRGRFAERWTEMLRWLAEHNNRRVITESNVISDEYQQLLNQTDSLVVQVTAPTTTRLRRLAEREGSWTDQPMIDCKPDLTINADDEGVRTLVSTVGERH